LNFSDVTTDDDHQAWGLWEAGRSHDLIDPAIRSDCAGAELAQAATCVQVALLCVQECPTQRPPMADVIPMLSRQVAPSQPQRPVVCTPRPMSHAHATALAVDAREITCGNSDLTITDLQGR
jgi:hypothetical protein